MKKVLLSALAAASLVFSPVAQADPEDFLSDAADAGFHITDANEIYVIALGLAACVDMFNGASAKSEVSDAMDMGFSYSDSVKLISIAVADLCPAAAGRRGSAA